MHTKNRQKTVNIFVDIESPGPCIVGYGTNNFEVSKLSKIHIGEILTNISGNAHNELSVALIL